MKKTLQAIDYQRVCIDIIETEGSRISKVRFNLFPLHFGRTFTRERTISAIEAIGIDLWLNRNLGGLV